MAERFYCPKLVSGEVELDAQEAHHVRVSRHRPGDSVVLFDGHGREAAAQIVALDRRSVRVRIRRIVARDRELPGRIVLCVPAPQGERQRWLVEKATELGVAELRWLVTERTDVHSRRVRLDRFHRWIIEACKQCGRNCLMEVHPPESWQVVAEAVAKRADACVLCDASGQRVADLGMTGRPRVAAVAVGPEGGWTEAELRAAREGGWRVLSLGPTVLRTETAALAAVSIVRTWLG